MFQFEFNLITYLLGIVSGVISTIIGYLILNKWIIKKPPKHILALTEDEEGYIDVTSKLGPNSPEFKVTSPQGEIAYTKLQTSTTDTGNVEQGN